LLGLVGFTVVTMVIGGPFYENIAERIEDDLRITMGHLDLSWWSQFLTGLRDGIPLLAIMVMPVAFAGGVLVALDVLGLAPSAARRAPTMTP
jgi:CysZ protein